MRALALLVLAGCVTPKTSEPPPETEAELAARASDAQAKENQGRVDQVDVQLREVLALPAASVRLVNHLPEIAVSVSEFLTASSFSLPTVRDVRVPAGGTVEIEDAFHGNAGDQVQFDVHLVSLGQKVNAGTTALAFKPGAVLEVVIDLDTVTGKLRARVAWTG